MAAGVVLGYLEYVLGFDSVQFRKGMSEAEREMVVRQKSFIKQGEKLQGLGKSMAAFISLPLAGLAAKGIQEARETAAAMGQVNAALASMGPVAGRSAEQLKKAADAFERSSLYEADEVLKKVTANMLTFGNIGGAAFDRAQQAAVNLSARLGQDLQSSAVMVGKALNDPVRGITALTRVGIQFTDQQKEQIKAMVEAGNAAGAQAIILGELERQFGGAAKAAQDADPFNKVTDAFKGMAEAIGTALLPLIPPLTNAITGLLNAFSALSPETQKWLIIIGGGAVVLGPVIAAVGTIMKVLAPMLPLILKLGPAWLALKAGLVAARVAALAALPALTPFLVPLGAIALAVGAVYLAWKNWDRITAIVSAVYNAVKTWLLDKLNAVWTGVKAKVDAVTGWFKGMYDAVVGHSYVPDMVRGIAAWMRELQPAMVVPAQEAAAATSQAFAGLGSDVRAANDDIVVSSRMASDEVIRAYGDMASGVIGSLKDMVSQFKSGDILGGLQTMLDMVMRVLDVLSRTGLIKLPAGATGAGGATPRAQGGPVVPGRTYLVGERGPEYVRFGSRGYVTPPRDGGGAARVTIVPTPYFDAVVDGRAAAVAMPLAGQAALSGAAGAQLHTANAMRRRIP